MMRRREFIATLGSAAAAWPIAARAQQGDRVRRIGVLLPYDENDPVTKPRVSAFTQALAELGWSDGSLHHGIVSVARREHADPPHAVALLCARRERPCRRAAEERDDPAPIHSITSSAK